MTSVSQAILWYSAVCSTILEAKVASHTESFVFETHSLEKQQGSLNGNRHVHNYATDINIYWDTF